MDLFMDLYMDLYMNMHGPDHAQIYAWIDLLARHHQSPASSLSVLIIMAPEVIVLKVQVGEE